MKGKSNKEITLRPQRFFIGASLTPMMILLFVFSIIPIAMSIVLSFTNSSGVGTPSFLGFQNYKELLTDTIFKKSIRNTLIFVLTAVPINLVVSTTMAAAISSILNKKIRDTLRGLFFMPSVVPVVALSYVWIMILEPTSGILNQVLSLFGLNEPIYWLNDARLALPSVIFVTLWCDLGYNLVLIMSGMDAIPKMFYEAAYIDGANPIQIFFKVTLPLLARTMLFVSIMTCISYFQVFAQVQIMTGGRPDNESQVLAFTIYQNSFQYMRLGYASSMAVVLLILILIVSVFQLVSVKIDWEY